MGLLRDAINGVQRVKHRRWRIAEREQYFAAVEGKHGIEVGGPSSCFKTVLPLYQHVGSLDGTNFATDTIWEGSIHSGDPYKYFGDRPGKQIISDATDLGVVPDGTYDFLLSSNCLEHIANPLKAMHEWRRVVKPGGKIILVLPRKESNFDHRRPITTIEHVREEFANEIGEDDLGHLDEILALHDLKRDKPAGNLEQFRARSLKNFENRALHHHIFDENLIRQVIAEVDMETEDVSVVWTDYYALARKPV